MLIQFSKEKEELARMLKNLKPSKMEIIKYITHHSKRERTEFFH